MTADEWLARAIVRMILSDNVLHRMEWKNLKTSMQHLGLEMDLDEIYDLMDANKSVPPEEFKLESFSNIPIAQKTKMLIKLAKVAAIDQDVVSNESEFFRKATSLLGMNQAFADKLLEWAEDLAKVNKKENKLHEFAVSYSKM